MPNRPEDLRTRTKSFALRIINLVSSLPKSTVSNVVAHQLLRSGTSVGANYREAYRSRSRAEFIAKIGDCLKELDETTYWLELLADARIVPGSRLLNLRDEADQLLAIFTSIARRSKRHTRITTQ